MNFVEANLLSQVLELLSIRRVSMGSLKNYSISIWHGFSELRLLSRPSAGRRDWHPSDKARGFHR